MRVRPWNATGNAGELSIERIGFQSSTSRIIWGFFVTTLFIILFAEHNLPIELLNLAFQDCERLSAILGQRIFLSIFESPPRAVLALEPAAFLQSREQWINSPGADLIPVTPQFLNHPVPDDGIFSSMMEDVDFPEPKEDFPLKTLCIVTHGISHITKSVIDGRNTVKSQLGQNVDGVRHSRREAESGRPAGLRTCGKKNRICSAFFQKWEGGNDAGWLLVLCFHGASART
jgi:hypothetical protein